MAVNISWYVENRVILVNVEGVVDYNEMHFANATMTNLLDQGQAPVHLIFDTIGLKHFPTNLNALRKNLRYFSHTNIGWIIVINTNPLLNFFAHIIPSLAKLNSRTVKTFEDAKQLLLRVDTSITV